MVGSQFQPVPEAPIGAGGGLPWLVQAVGLAEGGHFPDAVQAFLAAAKDDPTSVEAYLGLAWALHRSDQQKLAIQVVPEALKLNPDHVGAHVLLAYLLQDGGAQAQAAAVVNLFLRKFPCDSQVTGLLADLSLAPDRALNLLGVTQAAEAAVQSLQSVPAAPLAMPYPFANLSFSQEGEDLVLARIFDDRSQGFYVDIGAHHPLRFSNTHRFYLKGWRGINVEPNPELQAVFREVRTGDVNLTLGVSDAPGLLTYYMFNEPALNTFDPGMAQSRVSEVYQIVATQAVEVRPLADLLEEFLPPGRGIDFLSVDVEGLDLNVLKSNNWELYRPKCVVAEALRSDVGTVLESELHRFMTAQGYRFFAKTFNSVFYLEPSFQL